MDETAQGLENPFRQRRTIMPPTPNGHFGNSKQSGDRGITAKGHEYSIELTARHAALEARWGYGSGTGRHGSPKGGLSGRAVAFTRPDFGATFLLHEPTPGQRAFSIYYSC